MKYIPLWQRYETLSLACGASRVLFNIANHIVAANPKFSYGEKLRVLKIESKEILYKTNFGHLVMKLSPRTALAKKKNEMVMERQTLRGGSSAQYEGFWKCMRRRT